MQSLGSTAEFCYETKLRNSQTFLQLKFHFSIINGIYIQHEFTKSTKYNDNNYSNSKAH